MIRVGTAVLRRRKGEPVGDFVTVRGAAHCRIHVERMHPFFMTLASSSDHWLFLHTNGALTAGRKSPEHALFRYCTDDKIEDSAGRTGPKTLVLATRGGDTHLWEPLSDRYEGLLKGPIADADRRTALDALGKAGGAYREAVYAGAVPGNR